MGVDAPPHADWQIVKISRETRLPHLDINNLRHRQQIFVADGNSRARLQFSYGNKYLRNAQCRLRLNSYPFELR